jgi:hypothetical protein
VVSFLLTALPGPNYHCRPFSPYYNPPTELSELFFRSDAFFSCGDLVFSSHTTFMLLCVLTYTKYGRVRWLKQVFWAVVIFFGLLVASARKHYTLDIVMAFYVVPLVWVVFDHYCPDQFPAELLAREVGFGKGYGSAYGEADELDGDEGQRLTQTRADDDDAVLARDGDVEMTHLV